MSVPDRLRAELKVRLWEEADRLKWFAMPANEKARYYSMWTETALLGGKLSDFMDARQVRVYIKDTLLKSYATDRLADPRRVFRLIGLPADTITTASYTKPHGRSLPDGRQIAWGRAAGWKATLMAVYERSFESRGSAFAVVLFDAGTKHPDPQSRVLVQSAAGMLRIRHLVWID